MQRTRGEGLALEHHDVAQDAVPLDEAHRVLWRGRVSNRLDEVLGRPDDELRACHNEVRETLGLEHLSERP